MRLQTGLLDLKNTKQLTFCLWYTLYTLHFFLFFPDFRNTSVAHAKIVKCTYFYLNIEGKHNRTWLVHYCRLKFKDYCKLQILMWKFKGHFDGIIFLFISIFKQERWRLLIMNNRWKIQCRVANNKEYRVAQMLNVNCKLTAEFLW